jgi:hypothetical protein
MRPLFQCLFAMFGTLIWLNAASKPFLHKAGNAPETANR